jgi:hypothetical protein
LSIGGGFYLREEITDAPNVFYPFDSDTGIPLADIPTGGNRISVPGPTHQETLSCRQASISLAAGTYRISTSSSSFVDTPYADLFAADTFVVLDTGEADNEPPVRIMCPTTFRFLGDNGCYITDFTTIPVFQDCSPITLTQSGSLEFLPAVITVTATDLNGNLGEVCELIVTENQDPSCIDPCPNFATRKADGECPCPFGDNLLSDTGECGTPPDIGSACGYAILAKSGISTVPASTVTGNIGVSPIDATAITGFSLTLDTGGQFASSSQVVGEAHAADYGSPVADDLTTAVSDMEAAYTAAAALTTTDASRIEFLGGLIGGQTLTPGVYTFTTAVSIMNDLTFAGGPNDVFVIQTTGVLTIAADKKVILTGGVQSKNIFWQVAGNAAIGADAEFHGILLVFTDVALITGSSLVGSIYSQTAVALQKATVTADTCTREEPTVGPLQSGVDLGAACNYAILAKSGISTVPVSTVTGNIGVSPIAATAITGFSLTPNGGQSALSTQVDGEAHAADYGNPIAGVLTIAVLDMQAAYLDAASRNHIDATKTNIENGAIGGLTLLPGVYTFTVAISIYEDLTLDGDADSVFILKTTGVLTIGANKMVILTGGVQAKNIFWQVAGNAAIGADADFQGILLVKTDVVFITGSTLVGSIYSQTAVALQMATITEAAETCTTTIVETVRNLRIRI